MKKNLTKALVMIAVATALSGCGKGNFNGKYTGYEQQVQSSSTTTGTQYPSSYGMYGQTDQRIELNLKNDDEIVSGTVTYPDNGMTGQLSATATDSDKLNDVEIHVSQTGAAAQTTGGYNMMATGGCMGTFRGTLSAAGNGKRLTGTLNVVNAGGFGYNTCSGKAISVNKDSE